MLRLLHLLLMIFGILLLLLTTLLSFFRTPNPENPWIVFVSSRDGNAEIYRMRFDGTDQTRLTHHPQPDLSPAWSPDGKWIAFISYRDGHAEVYRMRFDGSHPQRLTHSPENKVRLGWHDNWIIFTIMDRDNTRQQRIRADGSDPQFATASPNSEFFPVLIQNKRWLVTELGGDGFIEIYRLTSVADFNAQLEPLTHSYPGESTSPAWSPIFDLRWRGEFLLIISLLMIGIARLLTVKIKLPAMRFP